MAVWCLLACYWIRCLKILHEGRTEKKKKKRGKTFVINNYFTHYQRRLAIRGTGIPRAFALIKCFACSLRFNDVVWKAALSMFAETERPWELASWVNKTSVSHFWLRETEREQQCSTEITGHDEGTCCTRRLAHTDRMITPLINNVK